MRTILFLCLLLASGASDLEGRLLQVGDVEGLGIGDVANAGGDGREAAEPLRFDDLADALAAARDGDRIEVHGGTHLGPFVIDKAIALVGLDRPVIDGQGRGSVLTLEKAGGGLSGFTIRGSGERGDKEDSGLMALGRVEVTDNRFEDVLYGINLKQAPGSIIARNHVVGRDLHIARRGDGIRIWESHGTRLEGNRVVGARDVVIWYSEDLLIRDNHVSDGRYGLHYMYSHASRIEANRLENNAVGAFMMYSKDLSIEENVFAGNHGPSGYGLAVKDSDDVSIRRNVFAGNRVGLYLDNSPSSKDARGDVSANSLAHNDIGLLLLPSVRGNRFQSNGFIENLQQVALTSGGKLEDNDWTPDGIGNFWSNYAGYDADGDGLGDLAHEEASLFESMIEKRPELRLFLLGPAQSMLDLAARAFPVFRPPATLVDTAPLTAPPASPITPAAGTPWPMLATAMLLLTATSLVLRWSRWDLDMDLDPGPAWSSGAPLFKTRRGLERATATSAARNDPPGPTRPRKKRNAP